MYYFDKLENDAIIEIVESLNFDLSTEDFKKRLLKNNYKGYMIVRDDEVEKIEIDVDISFDIASGIYKNKRIFIREKNKDLIKKILKHELIHAYLDNLLMKNVLVNGLDHTYGIGFEEGICSIVSSSENLDFFQIEYVNEYPVQVNILRQLDKLYELSGTNKYKNIIYAAMLEPENFINTVFKIFDEGVRYAANENNLSIDYSDLLNYSYKCAYNVLLAADNLCPEKNDTQYLIAYNIIDIFNLLLNEKNGVSSFETRNTTSKFRLYELSSELKLYEFLFGYSTTLFEKLNVIFSESLCYNDVVNDNKEYEVEKARIKRL